MSLVQKLLDGSLDVIGDVHGEIDALKTLVSNLGYNKDGSHPEARKLVFVGDLIDRGPDSPAVIKFVKNLIDQGNAQAILGNHELNLLQLKAKDGAGWYFSERFEKDVKYKPFNVASKEDEKFIYDFLSNLPLALEREDLRIVHATWDNEKINAIRSAKLGTVTKFYTDLEAKIDKDITSSGLLEAYNAEQDKWEIEQADSEASLPFLEFTCQYNLKHQMNNPVRVLTSGVEQRAKEPFYASGKWRFVERFSWWDNYTDDIPVIVGHFWRKFNSNNQDPENLFKDIEPVSWHGVKNNVFCVDFSVGARFLERNKNSKLGKETQLVALRWPENQLILESGQAISTKNFNNNIERKNIKKFF